MKARTLVYILLLLTSATGEEGSLSSLLLDVEC